MIRGKTEAETCALNGWTVGTLIIGDEGYGPTILRITAIGEQGILGVCEGHGGKTPCDNGPQESRWTLTCRDWEEFKPRPAEEFVADLKERLQQAGGIRGGQSE